MNGLRRLAAIAALAVPAVALAGPGAGAAPAEPPPGQVLPTATVTALPPPITCLRALTIDDRAAPEGTRLTEADAPYTSVSFPVSSNNNCGAAAAVSWTLQELTAEADADFVQDSGTLTFPAGYTGPRWLTVRVVRDGSPGPNEVYRVRLHSPSGAVLDDPSALGVIVNDDTTCQRPPGWVPQPPYYPDYHCSE